MRSIFFTALLLVVNGRQAQITTSASTAVVHPRDHVTLTVDVDLRPGVHVYAPGVENYIPISWTLEKSSTYQANNVDMPVPRNLHLDVIDETVPVYEGHFQLSRNLTIGPRHVHKGALNITGALRYQACDDRMCYKPETLPLQWTLTVERK
jgi:hypothetical protein